MIADLTLAHPLALLAAPLALLPWLRARERLPRFPYLALLPRDRVSDALGAGLRLAASIALATTVVALAAPYRASTAAVRAGEGAEIVVLLDRSRSMDQPFGDQPGMHWSDSGRESKGHVARRLLAQFARGRSADAFAFFIFSAQPILVLDFTSSAEAIQAAVSAQDVGRGLGETDIGRALEVATRLFEPRPYLGERLLLLVSDGGARLDDRMRARLTAALKRERVAVYWLYVRSAQSRGLADADVIENADAAPELALHRFLRSAGVPYRAYEAQDPKALERAIADIGRLEKHPIYTTYMEPRREYAGWLYALGATCAIVLLLARLVERPEWKAS